MSGLPKRLQFDNAAWQLLVVCVICVFAYWRGLSGGFQFDDFNNIVDNVALQGLLTHTHHWLLVALSTGTGLLRRPISMLSFGLNVLWFGMDPWAFKLVNLGLHLVNGVLIYAIGRRIASRLIGAGNSTNIRPEMLALAAASWWLLHPLNVSGVLYIVQRMNELATFFSLCGLLCYVDGRNKILSGEPVLASTLLALCLFGLLAVFSKENGALIVAYALVIETIAYRFEAPTSGQRCTIRWFFWISVAFPIALFAMYLILHPHWLSASYASGRDFSLIERLLSEARILCDYLLWIFVPNPAWMGLYHDDIATSTGLFHPISSLFSLGLLAALIVVSWKLRRRSPGYLFGIAWFFIGHSMESTILPLELVFEHRNYLPMAGLLLGSVCALAPIIPARWNRRWIVVACIAFFLGLAGLTTERAMSWGNSLAMALNDARHHPNSSRSQYAAGRALIIDGTARHVRLQAEQLAIPYFARAYQLDENDVYAASNLMFIRARTETISPSAIADLAKRLRTTPSYVQANSFFNLLHNATTQELTLTPDDISTLTQAALANPRFPSTVRAMIMNDYGNYQFNVAHNYQGAISMTLAAAAQDPKNPYFQINLAKISLAMKQPGKARKYLQAAQELDVFGQYANNIRELQKHLMH